MLKRIDDDFELKENIQRNQVCVNVCKRTYYSVEPLVTLIFMAIYFVQSKFECYEYMYTTIFGEVKRMRLS